MQTAKQQNNRRKAFRVIDQVSLQVKRLGKDDSELVEQDFEQRRKEFSVANHLRYGAEKHLPTMRLIQRKHPEIAEYLRFLQKQIEYISTQSMDAENTFDEKAETQEVDLSADGLRFFSDEVFALDELLEVRLRLFPEDIQLLVLGRVKRVEADKSKGCDVSLQFTHLHYEDEEALIKHLHKCQFEQLRHREDDDSC